MRINKYLSDSGVGSRRGVEKYIISGRVKVNGNVTTNLATDVNVETDLVTVDGECVSLITEKLYFALNKPKGFITSLSDEKGRKTVMEFVPDKYKKVVVPVGRLDYDSEGLLLFTNDGEYTQKVTKPKSKIPKIYVVKVEGKVDREQIKKLTDGVYIDNKKTLPANLKIVESNQKLTKIQITITEGKNRQIRRMFEAVGKFVIFLKRVQIGDLKLGGISRGEFKKLTKADAYSVFKLTQQK